MVDGCVLCPSLSSSSSLTCDCTSPEPNLNTLDKTTTCWRDIDIRISNRYVKWNCATSSISFGANWHLRVILTEVAYLTHTNTFFDIPVHPGNAPIHANNATGVQIAVKLTASSNKQSPTTYCTSESSQHWSNKSSWQLKIGTFNSWETLSSGAWMLFH